LKGSKRSRKVGVDMVGSGEYAYANGAIVQGQNIDRVYDDGAIRNGSNVSLPVTGGGAFSTDFFGEERPGSTSCWGAD